MFEDLAPVDAETDSTPLISQIEISKTPGHMSGDFADEVNYDFKNSM